MAANAPGLGSLASTAELRSRLLFVLFALVIYRMGSHITIPGVDPQAMSSLFESQTGGFLELMNVFGGGSLARMSIFALGVMPYISASIVVQLMSHVVPSLEELRKEGESGRRKLTRYTRYGTLGLATVQSIGIANVLQTQDAGGVPLVYLGGLGFIITATVTLVTGVMFLMWLGEQITERGIGNGISILIFAGIVAGLPSAMAALLEGAREGTVPAYVVLLLLIMTLGVTAFVVYVERAQRRIKLEFAKRQQGRKMVGGQSSHLPLKLNMAGVIPPIFASAIMIFPTTAISFFNEGGQIAWLQSLVNAINPGQPLYMVFYATAIIFFCFFYTALVFNARDTADNIKKSGAFIPGFRPGEQTARYIDTVLTRLTAAGAVYITLVCLMPEFLRIFIPGFNFNFGGTSLLIIVVVVMDFIAQTQTMMMSSQYENLQKKASLRGRSRS